MSVREAASWGIGVSRDVSFAWPADMTVVLRMRAGRSWSSWVQKWRRWRGILFRARWMGWVGENEGVC